MGTLETVLAWQAAVDAGDEAAAIALSDPAIAVGGPRGSARGHDAVRAWMARTGIALKPGAAHVAGDRAVVPFEAAWAEGGTGAIAIGFAVAGGRVVRAVRYDGLAEALAAEGLG